MVHYEAILPEVAKRSSELERRAEEAERETVKLKKVEYMEQHIGEAFDGVISGVTAYGLYVELNNTVEGLVHVNSLTDDFYEYDEAGSELRGARTGKVWRIGESRLISHSKCLGRSLILYHPVIRHLTTSLMILDNGSSSALGGSAPVIFLCQSVILACDKSQDFFCEGNDNAACKGQKSVSSLGRVMGFEGKTNLHDTKAEHNHTNSPHQTENEIGQIVDYLNGVIGSKGGYGSTKHKGQGAGLWVPKRLVLTLAIRN